MRGEIGRDVGRCLVRVEKILERARSLRFFVLKMPGERDAKTMDANESSRVAAFYANCNILLTGGTGFIGKLLVQKLLSSCPDIGDIYIVIRKKKGNMPDKRLDDILSNTVFDDMKKIVPNYREKIHAVLGDIQYADMGLHQDDRNMLIDKIHIVIHCGATVNFSQPLKTAVHTNVRGTRDVLKLAEEMKNLKCMMYVSTAYSNCNQLSIGEHFYKPPILPDTLIKMVDEMDDEVQKKLTPIIIDKWPNTYVYSKAVAEQLIKNKMEVLPVGVFRPSIVYPTYKDPKRCWLDGVNGHVGMIAGIMAGVYHVLPGDVEKKYDAIPADIVVNGLIAAMPDVTKQFQENRQRKSIIYNCVAKLENSMKAGDMKSLAEKYYDLPFTNIYYSEAHIFVKYRWLELILRVLIHYSKALLIDGFLLVSGKKPRMVKLYRTIHKYSDAVTFFKEREFLFNNDNMLRLWDEQSPVDQQLYPFSMTNFDWDDYMKSITLGIKMYLMKDKMDEESIKKAILKRDRFRMLHRVLQVLTLLGCLYVVRILFNKMLI